MAAVRQIDFTSPTAKEEFVSSLLETGFAVLNNHGVDPNRISSVYSEWSKFLSKLAKSPELKERYLRDPKRSGGSDGYFPCELAEVAKTATARDLKQYYQLYQGERYPEGVTDEAKHLFHDMTKLGSVLLDWIDGALSPATRAKLDAQGITNLSETLSVQRTMLRILHYPAYDPATVEAGQIRSAQHEDINWITVLPAGSTKGLQLCLDGETWSDVPFARESIIVNLGDMLQELTAGRFRSTTHRVVTSEDATPGLERMSVPCFIHAKKEVVLSHRNGSPFTADDYLMNRLTQLERMNDNSDVKTTD
jgi:isopenicillin N synthase-like dioxygenase